MLERTWMRYSNSRSDNLKSKACPEPRRRIENPNFCVLVGAMLLALSFSVHAQDNFFQGKSIRVIRGGQPGDLYDLWTRHIATYLGKHIPGNPSVTVQNMPGAGSVIAANYVYNVAKPDGLTLGSLNSAIYMDQVIGRKEVQFDWAKFNWIGTPESTELLFIIRGDSPYKTIDDLRKGAEPPKCGSTGTASITYHIPRLIEDVLGAKSVIIAGYQGAGDIDVALERGELQCRLITIAAFFGREPHITWYKKGFTRPLVQTGRKRDPLLPDTPTPRHAGHGAQRVWPAMDCTSEYARG